MQYNRCACLSYGHVLEDTWAVYHNLAQAARGSEGMNVRRNACNTTCGNAGVMEMTDTCAVYQDMAQAARSSRINARSVA